MRNTYEISSKEERQDKRKDLNPRVDRAPVKVGHIDESKLRIELVKIEGLDPIVFQYSGTVDWANQASVTALNRWRKDTFYHNLGPLHKQPRTTKKELFLDREISWLAAQIGVSLSQDKYGRYRGWTKLTKKFNTKFGGQVFQENPVRRPHRTTAQLRSLKSDIDEKLARGLAVDDHTKHNRHAVGGNGVMGSNRVKQTGAQNKIYKYDRGNQAGGYSWALLRFLAKHGYTDSESESNTS